MPLIHRLAFVLGAVALLAAGARAAESPSPDLQLFRAIYQELIEINTTASAGDTVKAAEAMAARLRDAGFPPGDVQVLSTGPRKGNLVARLRGTGARKPILLLAHLDVVEAKREDWDFDPFTLQEVDGFFRGRGAIDDKAMASIFVSILIQYRGEGFTPDRDIIVALTADEEGGGPYNGVQWLLKNHRDLIDAEFCLNEGGYGELAAGKRVSNDIEVSEKYRMDIRLEVRNKGGHSSMPVPDNAIYHLAGALDRLGKFAFPLKTNDVTRAFFAAQAKIEAGPHKADLAKVAQNDADAMRRIAAASTVWNATLRTTCVATQVTAGHARNALPQLAAANVNCRVLPDESPDSVVAAVKRAVADDEVSVKIDGDAVQGPPSPIREDLLRAASRVTDTMWPGVPVVPMMVMYATDGKHLRIAGIPTYGLQGIFQDRDDVRWHGRDERILVQSFYEGQQFLYELVKDLTK